MKIDRGEARRIAALAHLEFDDAALDRMAGEMTKILEYVESLPVILSRGDGEETRRRHPSQAQDDVRTPLRDDVVRASVDRDGVAQNAPEWAEGFFVVPPVIE